jgi:hypothetical protein
MRLRGSIISAAVLAACVSALAATPAFAEVERVALLRVGVGGFSAIIQRQNRDIWTIEIGSGCPAINLYERRWVAIQFDGYFGSFGSYLVLPNDEQFCQIWDADEMQ